jgi:hypothetical protein
MVSCKKFRFDFSKEITEMLSNFSKNHSNEHRKQFQQSWNDWISEDCVKRLFENERNVLHKEGFEGDVFDKMYKSARYYYKKRCTMVEEQKKRGPIVHTNRFSSNFLKTIDTIIENQLYDEMKVEKGDIVKSQVEFFEKFCLLCSDDIIMELKIIKSERGEIPEDIKEKLKKTYKNRFYKKRVHVVKD